MKRFFKVLGKLLKIYMIWDAIVWGFIVFGEVCDIKRKSCIKLTVNETNEILIKNTWTKIKKYIRS